MGGLPSVGALVHARIGMTTPGSVQGHVGQKRGNGLYGTWM